MDAFRRRRRRRRRVCASFLLDSRICLSQGEYI